MLGVCHTLCLQHLLARGAPILGILTFGKLIFEEQVVSLKNSSILKAHDACTGYVHLHAVSHLSLELQVKRKKTQQAGWASINLEAALIARGSVHGA